MRSVLPTLFAVAEKFVPNADSLSDEDRLGASLDILGILYLSPLALSGMVWLIAITDLTLLGTAWVMQLLLFGLVFLFRRIPFFILLELRPGTYTGTNQSVESIVVWWGALLFGPSALWLGILWTLIDFVRRWPRLSSPDQRRYRARATISETAMVLPSLIALSLYTRWGGSFPLSGLALGDTLPAIYATAVQYVVSRLIVLPLVISFSWGSLQLLTGETASRSELVKFIGAALAIPYSMNIFAILAVGLQGMVGIGAALLFVANLLLGSFLSNQLSRAVEYSRQRSRELEQLEQLGRAIINGPADASTLPALVRELLPGMFPPGCRVEIRLYPDQTFARHPQDWSPVPDVVWEWLRGVSEAQCFPPKRSLPWDDQPASHAIAVTPIVRADSLEPIGGIYLQRVSDLPEVGSVVGLLPALQSLAAQIASALRSAEIYEQTLAHQRVVQELALAGEIQTSFLPDAVPAIDGWQVTATLEPARETSGDFFDVIPLPNGRLGLVMADVADKGLGAALYMALCRTLIRTYAAQYDTQPDQVLDATNCRILQEAHADLFVTVFYGILDPATGLLTYCNAGHNPPYLLSTQNGGRVQILKRTGLPVGLFDDRPWAYDTIQLAPGDTLVMYTDGLTEARNRDEALFGEERLLEIIQTSKGRPAQEVQNALVDGVHQFVGDAPRFDDITLLVVVRDS